MLEARRLEVVEPLFGLQAAGRLLTEVFAPWVQDLGLLVESVEAGRPPGAPADWQPGAVLRLPFSRRICREGGAVCAQALTAVADAAMMVACFGGLERLQADEPDRPDHALPASGDVRRRRRRPRGAGRAAPPVSGG